MRVEVSDLVGAQEIATRLGLDNATTVNAWTKRGLGFPEPVHALALGQLWLWPDVEKWARKTGRIDADGNPVRRRGGRRPKPPAA